MTAYSFQKQFIGPIQAGSKLQTIRQVGKRRHAKVGHQLQLYSGMRTIYCRKIIDDVPCLRFDRVRINFGLRTVVIGPDGGPLLKTRRELDLFSILDGFENWEAMDRFWLKVHPAHRFFDGVMPGWGKGFWE